ncbi:MAG: toxin-antitoxin system antidote component [Algoriphagus marincola HL-49]|uniref:Toxin-antitoxin system antidote component n=1 Tax=Algoriphagus marincola HL-49 TaxID=1305737 RepID=A0A0P8CB95_9BACT|nr:MAG: toxin-antitoxin system antidote component [Algoriphagus marincola HL-49]
MENSTIRKELHHLIDGADEDLLRLVYSILLPKDQVSDFSREQLDQLEKRFQNHLKNPEEGKTWDEVKAKLKK